LEEIEAVLPDVEWNGCAGDQKGSDEEDAVGDSNFAEDIFHLADRARPNRAAA
jgi:hypothetical protein